MRYASSLTSVLEWLRHKKYTESKSQSAVTLFGEICVKIAKKNEQDK